MQLLVELMTAVSKREPFLGVNHLGCLLSCYELEFILKLKHNCSGTRNRPKDSANAV